MTTPETPWRKWMHVYGQYAYHAPARIVGTREALVELRDAITRALTDGRASVDEVCASDGEGYGIDVQRVDLVSAIGRPEYYADAAHRLFSDEARRAKEVTTPQAYWDASAGSNE